MHSILTTQGFILGSKNYGEADKIFLVFTKEFGLIYASAQGIRLEKSKLRYYGQDYSFRVFSLVKGREYWRITNIQEIEKNDESKIDYVANDEVNGIIIRLANLLRRFLQGEEPNEPLYELVESVLYTNINSELLPTLESLLVLRVLNLLGYIGNNSEISIGLEGNMSDELYIKNLQNKRVIFNQHINKAIKESHL